MNAYTGSEGRAVHDVVLSGGRVLDPESGLDARVNVGIVGPSISAVTTGQLAGRRVIDVSDFVVAPGWIDLHSHSHTVGGLRLQAMDGVTTALELEAGVSSVGAFYAAAQAEGRPVNYGYATSWAQLRMQVLAGLGSSAAPDAVLQDLGNPRWHGPATPLQIGALLRGLARDLEDGALGVGLLLGYAPGVEPTEYLAVSELAAGYEVPTYTHARDLVEHDPRVPVDGAEEIVRAAGATGVHAHYCHVNSTSLRSIDRVLALVERARAEGGRVTTEAYPYGAGMTAIAADFLRPEQLARRGIDATSVVHASTGERMPSVERLAEMQARDPGGLAIVHYLEESRSSDREFMDRALLSSDTIIASDAMPVYRGGRNLDPFEWPIASDAVTHPRTAGTFSKVFRRYVRELGAMTLMEAVRRCSFLPAQTLESAVPAMRLKGRVRPGCDADLVVFDPATVGDRSSYEHSTLPSTGYAHVFVAGQQLVRDFVLDVHALPGRAVRR